MIFELNMIYKITFLASGELALHRYRDRLLCSKNRQIIP